MEITNIDFSAILEMVNTFYNNAWYSLIAVLGVATLVLPIVLKKLLDYRTRIEIDKVEENLRKQFHNLSGENEKLIEKNIIDATKKLDEANAKKFDDINVKINASEGISWHILGNLKYEKEDYKLSLQFYFYAFDSYFFGKDESNMQTIMNCIKKAYKHVKDLSLLEEIEKKQLNLIEKVNEINENHRYSKLINEMGEALNNLKKRLKEGKN